MTESTLGAPSGALRQEFEAIAALLSESPSPAARDEGKRRIIALFRGVESGLAELGQLKEEIRGLVERYKELAAEATGGGSPPGIIGQPPLHQDHLGASTFIEKGWSLISLGDPAGAMQSLRRALELSPGDVQAESLLGWAQMLAGQYDDALSTFSRVLVREPGNALARVNVGYICMQKRIFGEAIEHLSRAIRLDNDRKATLYAHHYLGLVYLERGMYEDAQGFLRKAVVLGPSLTEAWYDLGRAQWFAGGHDAARDSWTEGAAGNRFGPWARRCQDLLESTARGEEVPRSRSS